MRREILSAFKMSAEFCKLSISLIFFRIVRRMVKLEFALECRSSSCLLWCNYEVAKPDSFCHAEPSSFQSGATLVTGRAYVHDYTLQIQMPNRVQTNVPTTFAPNNYLKFIQNFFTQIFLFFSSKSQRSIVLELRRKFC